MEKIKEIILDKDKIDLFNYLCSNKYPETTNKTVLKDKIKQNVNLKL